MKHLLFRFFTIWFVITQTFPPFFYFVPLGQALSLAIYIGGVIALFPSLLISRSMMALFGVSIVNFLFYFSGNKFISTPNDFILPFLTMGSSLLIAEYAYKYNSVSFIKSVVLTSLIFNVIMAIISIPQLLLFPNIIRGASLSADAMETKENSALYYWIVNYGTVHGLPAIIAPLAYLCKRNLRISKIRAFWGIAALVIICILIFMSNATTSLAITIIMLIFAIFFGAEKLSKKIVARISIVSLLAYFLVQPVVLVPIIDGVQSVMDESSSNYKKMNQIRNIVIYGEAEGDVVKRSEIYQASKDLFYDSPFVGTSSPDKIGQHSYFWDRLALYGLLFITPLVFLFVVHIKKSYKLMIHSKLVYLYGVAAFLTMLYLKNEFGAGTWFYAFALLPLICKYIDITIQKKC